MCSDAENKTYDLLEKLGIGYTRISHEAAMTIDDCAGVDALLGVPMCKNLFLCNRQETEFYLLMLPGRKQFKTKELSARLGSSRLSFAGGGFMERYLGIKPGSLSVLGLANDTGHRVRLCIDSDLIDCEYTGCHPCVNTSSLKIKTSDLLEIFIPYTGHKPEIVTLCG
jgi:Ala-tRNA(Pro) deacylase